MRLVKFVPIVVFCLNFNLIASEESKGGQIYLLPEDLGDEDVDKFFDSIKDSKLIKVFKFYFSLKNSSEHKYLFNSKLISDEFESLKSSTSRADEGSYEKLFFNKRFILAFNGAISADFLKVKKLIKRSRLVFADRDGRFVHNSPYLVLFEFKIEVVNKFRKNCLNRDSFTQESEKRLFDLNVQINKLITDFTKKHSEIFNLMVSSSRPFNNDLYFLSFIGSFIELHRDV